MNRRHFLQASAAAFAGVAFLPSEDWQAWRVNGSRVNRRLADLSRYGRNPQGGVSRVAFSQADIDGRQFAMEVVGAGVHMIA